MSKIAALSELAITICMAVPTFLGFKHRLVSKNLLHPDSRPSASIHNRLDPTAPMDAENKPEKEYKRDHHWVQ